MLKASSHILFLSTARRGSRIGSSQFYRNKSDNTMLDWWHSLNVSEKKNHAILLNPSDIVTAEHAFMQGEAFSDLGVGYSSEAKIAYQLAAKMDPNYKTIVDEKLAAIDNSYMPAKVNKP